MEETNKTWKEVFLDNYNGRSEEAKEVADFIKANYKGNNYIPWATMERLTYMQDENATFRTIETKDGNIVWTDTCENVNEVVADGVTKQASKSVMFSHFVKVSLKFMGKTYIEEYPIQDQDYSALKVYNQNAVNKALKRALAKVASRATGIGLKLYENKDLQFDTPVEETKPVVKKSEPKKVEQPKVEEPKVIEQPKVEEQLPVNQTGNETTQVVEEPKQTLNYNEDVISLCNLIKTSDANKMTKILQTLNVAILKQHGFTLNLTDTDVELCEKLNHFKDVSIFTRAINNMLG